VPPGDATENEVNDWKHGLKQNMGRLFSANFAGPKRWRAMLKEFDAVGYAMKAALAIVKNRSHPGGVPHW